MGGHSHFTMYFSISKLQFGRANLLYAPIGKPMIMFLLLMNDRRTSNPYLGLF